MAHYSGSRFSADCNGTVISLHYILALTDITSRYGVCDDPLARIVTSRGGLDQRLFDRGCRHFAVSDRRDCDGASRSRHLNFRQGKVAEVKFLTWMNAMRFFLTPAAVGLR